MRSQNICERVFQLITLAQFRLLTTHYLELSREIEKKWREVFFMFQKAIRGTLIIIITIMTFSVTSSFYFTSIPSERVNWKLLEVNINCFLSFFLFLYWISLLLSAHHWFLYFFLLFLSIYICSISRTLLVARLKNEIYVVKIASQPASRWEERKWFCDDLWLVSRKKCRGENLQLKILRLKIIFVCKIHEI